MSFHKSRESYFSLSLFISVPHCCPPVLAGWNRMSQQHARLADGDAAPGDDSAPGQEPPTTTPTQQVVQPQKADCNESVPQVCVLPDGEMVFLSKDNPYARSFAESNGGGAGAPSSDPYAVPVPEPLLANFQQPIILERMGRIVRLLALFDLVRASAGPGARRSPCPHRPRVAPQIFSLMNVLANLWPAAITAIMAYCGYVGARMFRRDLTRVYLFYVILIAIVRISVTVQWALAPNVSASAQIFLVISSVLQLVIAHFVWRFYSLLPTTEEESRFIQYVAEAQAGRGIV